MRQKQAFDDANMRRMIECRVPLRDAAVDGDQFLLICQLASLETRYIEARRAAVEELLELVGRPRCRSVVQAVVGSCAVHSAVMTGAAQLLRGGTFTRSRSACDGRLVGNSDSSVDRPNYLML